MIPQIARRLLKKYKSKNHTLLFDPFCGSGTVLVEGVLLGLDVIGTDLNPLARLISKSKCTNIDIGQLREAIKRYSEFAKKDPNSENEKSPVPDFKNLTFWFNSRTIAKLTLLRKFVFSIPNDAIRLFFTIAFSETVRESSISKPGEFKLVRAKDRIENGFNPDVFGTMLSKLNRNLDGLTEYISHHNELTRKPQVRIEEFDSSICIPQNIIGEGTIDLVITSPPYGDSSTTVAYGQFSRLSNQWLGIEDEVAFKVDKHLMGGVRSSEIQNFNIPKLDMAISVIDQENHSRALEVSSFYSDLLNSCSNVSKVVKFLGYVCYVVSNRRVKGITLPTDTAIIDFFERNGFYHVRTYTRNIPNKRMPSRNSPTNVKGLTDKTMSTESIIVLQKHSKL